MFYLLSLLILGILILIHEAGHLLAAKWVGIPISRFSIGFGSKIWSFQKNETEYRISLLPLGGYVMPKLEDEFEFFAIPSYKRIIFAIAGPLANLAACVFLFAVLNLTTTGFSFLNIFVYPFAQTFAAIIIFLKAVPSIISQPEAMSGLPSIIVEGGNFIQSGFANIIQFAVFFNINLAVLNMLPILPLDGGKVLLYFLEGFSKKSLRLQAPLSAFGWLAMIGFMIYVNARDTINYLLKFV